jgi:hypothetical protein
MNLSYEFVLKLGSFFPRRLLETLAINCQLVYMLPLCLSAAGEWSGGWFDRWRFRVYQMGWGGRLGCAR